MQITRQLTIPDPVRISRYQRLPELGPNLLFFSGGTALNGISRVLKHFTHNSAHLITPFDSGGSSATLRQAFDMPAIGDVRSRLMALADESLLGHPEVYQLFSHRFPKTATQNTLRHELAGLVGGSHPLITAIPMPMRGLIQNQLQYFAVAMPADFDLHGASIGNLILAGGYLNNNRELDPILFLFSKLVNTLGHVTVTTNEKLHLAARLSDHSVVVGQHAMTGKEVEPLTSRIEEIFLTTSLESTDPVDVPFPLRRQALVRQADLICYPPGSFYSSLMANLLPKGVGRTIAENGNPKVYIPSLGTDPELNGISPNEALLRLIDQLKRDAGADTPTKQLLNFVLADESYAANFDLDLMEKHELKLISAPLTSQSNAAKYDPQKLVDFLLSLT
ncbi:GAK system CofD-like protein [Pseudovibrio exalbescens]|uniref:GAK system CofD-like protein n=1 Tax=Pseudovibrio exalbescens TaxID=197461 RepID=UPI002366EDDF|nr:GAK system CofD-like protein [Pseudovibrio exalbescens]MDD7910766.1 GAK system CofD-like protein [Pseudovibrio exalbescens]